MRPSTAPIAVVTLFAVVYLLLAAATTAHGATATASLTASTTKVGADAGVLAQVTLANPTDATVRVLSWETPADGLTAPLFDVTRDGEPVAYTGILAKRAAPTPADYIALAPGEQRTYTVNLAQSYSFDTTGTYVIRYATTDAALYLTSASTKRAGTLTSGTTTVDVVGRPDPAPPAPSLEAASVEYTGCSGTQQTGLISAVAGALAYTQNASTYFSDNRAGARYRLWFGTYDAARWGTVENHFAAMNTALGTAALQFTCNDPCSTDLTVYAFVISSAPYRVYLCGAFWGAPDTGTDSRAGTLVHELSHFTVLAGTTDHVYGTIGAKNLAVSNPEQAIENADNYEYFAENTPATPDNAAAYTLTTATHDFGTVSTGSTSGDHTVVLTSTGDVGLVLGTLATTGDFVLTGDTCSGATLAPAAACTFTAAFSPSATGARTGSISLPGNAVAAPTTVALSGNGLAAPIPVDPNPAPSSPAPAAVPAVPVAQRSAAPAITVRAVRGTALRLAIAPSDTACTFRIQRQRRDGKWVALKATYSLARGVAGRSIDLPSGTYRVVLPSQSGYTAATSGRVALRR